MKKSIIMSFGGLSVAALVAYAGGTTTRAGYESAPYGVVRTDGPREIRDYPVLNIVHTPMRGKDDGFMRLYRYIDGQNAAARKIPMTTPVLVTIGATNATMAFVMPGKMTTDQIPQPKNDQVTVATIPAGTFAVLRFGGGRNGQSETNAVVALTAWLQQEQLQAVGEPTFAYFDPPWIPTFLRRNEVMLRLAP